MKTVVEKKEEDLSRRKILIQKGDGFSLEVDKEQCPQLTSDFKC